MSWCSGDSFRRIGGWFHTSRKRGWRLRIIIGIWILWRIIVGIEIWWRIIIIGIGILWRMVISVALLVVIHLFMCVRIGARRIHGGRFVCIIW